MHLCILKACKSQPVNVRGAGGKVPGVRLCTRAPAVLHGLHLGYAVIACSCVACPNPHDWLLLPPRAAPALCMRPTGRTRPAGHSLRSPPAQSYRYHPLIEAKQAASTQLTASNCSDPYILSWRVSLCAPLTSAALGAKRPALNLQFEQRTPTTRTPLIRGMQG